MFHVEHDRCCENRSMEVGSAGRKTERGVPRGTIGEPQRPISSFKHSPSFHVELLVPMPADPRPRETAARSGESKLDPSITIPLSF